MAGKITPEIWSRSKSGEISDLIVEFDDTAVETEARRDFVRRGRKIEDDAALARKVENLRKLYANLAESLPLIGRPAVAATMNRKGAGASVAVLDTGLNYTRSEFGAMRR